MIQRSGDFRLIANVVSNVVSGVMTVDPSGADN
jgi:hypothetical protein